LGEWDEGPAIVVRILGGAVLHPTVAADLADALLQGNRSFARRLLAARLHEWRARAEVRAVIRGLHRCPLPEGREVLRTALALPDEELRCYAVEALDELAEDGPTYRDILRALAGRSDPMLRLVAARALVRRGEARFLAPILAARTDADANLRAF